MKKIHLTGIAVALALGVLVCVASVWSLGAIASEDVPAIRIETVHAPVEIKHPGETEWKTLDATTAVQIGDEIRTGAEGKANIRWGDRGETRLDSDTDLVIESAPTDANSVTNATIQLRLASGRAWSRVLKLLDVESGFEVKSDAVVATVRGTAFGVARTATDAQLAVTESVVDVTPTSGGPSMLLREGKWGSFSPTGTPNIVRDLLPTDAWPQDNKLEDQKFDAALQEEAKQRLEKRLPSAPAWLVGLSEGVHLALAPADLQSDLLSKYIGRRIAQAVASPEDAADVLKFDPSWVNVQGAGKERVLRDVRLALLLQEPRAGFVPAKSLVTALQDLRARLLGTDPAGGKYALALNLDDRIDEVMSPPSPLSPADKQQAGEEVLTDIADWKAGLPADTGLSADDLALLNAKADALRARLIEDGIAPPPAVDAPEASVPLPAPTLSPATTIPPKVPAKPVVAPVVTPVVTPPSIVPPPAPVACTYQSYAVFAKPNASVNIGDSVTVTFLGTCISGKTDDLTAHVAFSAAAKDGSFSGNVFTPSHAGTITLFGAYAENGISGSAKTTIGVKPTVRTLTGVKAGVIGATTLSTGQNVPLTATASYSDGTTANVIYQCAWSTDDARLGYISNQRFYAGTGTGTVSATCTYTEAGATVTGSITFTIQLDASLMPTNSPGGRQSYAYPS